MTTRNQRERTHEQAGDSWDREFGVPDDRHDGDGRLVEFAREYGWRAYAIPVLAVVTLFVVINMFQHPDEPVVGAAELETNVAEEQSDDAKGEGEQLEPAVLPEGVTASTELPPGGPFTEHGEGTFYEVGVPGANGGVGDEIVVRYVVEVEHGVDTTAYGGGDAFSAMVDATLLDPRSWTNDPRFRFEHVSAADDPSLRIRLTSVGTTRELCGADLGLETSCRTRITGEDTVVINESRWVRGAAPFEGDLGRYRQYVINHEVGHAVGFSEHVPCEEDGALAPIMMQQTLSLNNAELYSFDPNEVYPDNNSTCRSNPWPYPRPAVQ
ncbi:DUF3152 domain-containing protein [Corynebacterium sp. TA-R-1]|uniref:DUF3152 domain-containing protein n=1 Tax=Corynebacterium stercoris TaxID=2943490 RepID=A0ABT1G4I2_9CORY|nr:DUF3152 domain-containing protein [Corynebacterium stercoris]MCP1387948.1 DUF3152 domain-containing protein [Corynebacterium stercoris]